MVIREDAVEVLANILDATERKGLPSGEPSWAHWIARTALEALAVQEMLADAWDAGKEAGMLDYHHATNPYRPTK